MTEMMNNQSVEYENVVPSEYMHDDDGNSDGNADTADSSTEKGLILEQDRLLPLANIGRIMKNVLPDVGKLSKEAKECMQECVSEFLLFVSSEASDVCASDSRKTLSGDDVVAALLKLGFDNYVEPAAAYLRKYREAINGKVIENSKEVRSPSSCGNSMVYAPTIAAQEYTTQPVDVMHGQPTQYVGHSQQYPPSHVYQAPPQNIEVVPTSSSAHLPADDALHVQELQEVNLQPVQMFSDVRTGQHYLRTGDGNFVPIAFLTNQGAPPAPLATMAPQPPTVATVIAPPTSRSSRGRSRTLNAVDGGHFDDVDTSGEQSVGSYLRRQQKLNPKRNAK